MPRSLNPSIRIGAPRARVWSMLMDFASYPEWNTFIRSIKGTAAVGETIEVVIEPPGRRAQTSRPQVIAFDPSRRFAWRGSLPIPGLFVGEHNFELRDEGAGTVFSHSEGFSGILLPFVGGVLADSQKGFVAMNEKLRARAEAQTER